MGLIGRAVTRARGALARHALYGGQWCFDVQSIEHFEDEHHNADALAISGEIMKAPRWVAVAVGQLVMKWGAVRYLVPDTTYRITIEPLDGQTAGTTDGE